VRKSAIRPKSPRTSSTATSQSVCAMRPGLQFYCFPSKTPYEAEGRLELVPKKNELYVICTDGTVQAVNDPDRHIGWEVYAKGAGWEWRSWGTEPEPCMVSFHSTVPDPPVGRSLIGTIDEEQEEGEPEVTSNISFPPLGQFQIEI